MLDNDFRFTYLNDQAVRLVKRRREDIIGKSVWQEFPEAADTDLYQALHHARATGENTSLQLYYAPLEMWVNLRIFPHEKGLSVYFRDISEQSPWRSSSSRRRRWRRSAS